MICGEKLAATCDVLQKHGQALTRRGACLLNSSHVLFCCLSSTIRLQRGDVQNCVTAAGAGEGACRAGAQARLLQLNSSELSPLQALQGAHTHKTGGSGQPSVHVRQPCAMHNTPACEALL